MSTSLGAHLSIKGGIHRVFEAAALLKISAVQMFLKNNNRWVGKNYSGEDIERYYSGKKAWGGSDVFAHAGYLINLSGGEIVRRRSVIAMKDEMERAAVLGIPSVVVHPGSHGGSSVASGISRTIKSINAVLKSVPSGSILLETAAGQGNSIGFRFEHLAEIIQSSPYHERLFVCLDTCHVYAAGYDIVSVEGYSLMKDEIRSTVGADKIRLIHLNDSKKKCGSRVDRHEHLGKGFIGLKGFHNLLLDQDFAHIPVILETPKTIVGMTDNNDCLAADRMNLKKARSILSKRLRVKEAGKREKTTL